MGVVVTGKWVRRCIGENDENAVCRQSMPPIGNSHAASPSSGTFRTSACRSAFSFFLTAILCLCFDSCNCMDGNGACGRNGQCAQSRRLAE